jgi:hypothetical protein
MGAKQFFFSTGDDAATTADYGNFSRFPCFQRQLQGVSRGKRMKAPSAANLTRMKRD